VAGWESHRRNEDQVQIVVQEGTALVSLLAPVQAPDENLRTTVVESISGPVKVFYRDYEIVRVLARDDALEVFPAAIGSVSWLEKTRRYQLKVGGQPSPSEVQGHEEG